VTSDEKTFFSIILAMKESGKWHFIDRYFEKQEKRLLQEITCAGVCNDVPQRDFRYLQGRLKEILAIRSLPDVAREAVAKYGSDERFIN
jgi:hypothetical protein